MAIALRQGTAVTVTIGQFVSSTDAYTPVTGLTPAVSLSKAGGALVPRNEGTPCADATLGYYQCNLDDTDDTAVAGPLILLVPGSAAHLPIRHEFQVFPAAVYDELFAPGATGTAGALTAYHLDRLYANAYDPASPPGNPSAMLNQMVEDDGAGITRFTANALSQAPGSVSGSVSGPWRWNTSTAAADPGSGRVSGDNASLAAITAVYLNQVSNNDFNASGAIEALNAGDTLVLARDGQGSNFFLATVQADPVDNGDWYTIPVNVTDSGGSFGNNNIINVSFNYAQPSITEIRDAVWEAPLAAYPGAGSAGLALSDTDGNTSGLAGEAMRGTDDALLAAAAPANFGDLSITVGSGQVVVGTNTDKDGYTIAGTLQTLDALRIEGAADRDLILADTAAIQGQNVSILADTGAIRVDTGSTLPGLISSQNDLSEAQVKAQVVAALATDTYPEPGAVPAATASLASKISWLQVLARNGLLQEKTASVQRVRNDADTADIATAPVSDDGETWTRGKFT